MDQRFILKSFYPFRNMADLAIFFTHIAIYFCRICCSDMFRAGPVTYLAAGILQVGGFFKTDKPPWLSIPCGVTVVTLLDLFRGKVFHLFLNALK